MTVTLNIQNDEELRLYIKDLIKGQVLSLTRDEIFEQVKEEINRKIKGITTTNADYMIKQSVQVACSNIIYKEFPVNNWLKNYIQPSIEQHVQLALKGKNWGKLIDDLAKEKIKSLI